MNTKDYTYKNIKALVNQTEEIIAQNKERDDLYYNRIETVSGIKNVTLNKLTEDEYKNLQGKEFEIIDEMIYITI